MQVLSPVGTFPLRLQRARIDSKGLAIETEMGAWRSEVRLDRHDAALAAAVAGALALSFSIGRVTARGRR